MAVEKAKMIARFKVVFPKINLSKKRMDIIMDKLSKKPADDADDAAIDLVLNDYNEVIDFEDLAKSDDRERKLQADNEKLQADLKKKGKTTETEEEEEEEVVIPEDAPQWAKDLAKNNQTLKSELDGFKNGNATSAKRKLANDAFEKSETLKGLKPEIKEKWMNRLDLESEVSFEDQVKELETEHVDLVQGSADTTQYGGAAGQGAADAEANQEDVDKVLDNMSI